MSILSQLRIGPRLAAGYGALVALIVIQACLTWVQLRSIDHAVAQVVDDRYPKIQLTASIRDAANIQVRYLRGAALAAITGDRRLLDESLAKVTETAQTNTRTIEALGGMLHTSQGKQLFDAVGQARGPFATLRDKAVALLRNGQAIEGANLIMTEVREAQMRYETELQAFTDFQQGLMRDSSTQARQRVEQVGLISWGVTAAVVALALLAAWTITRSITTPIAQAAAVAQAVAAGDLRVRPRATTRDETGQLLDALGEMTRKLSALVDSVRHGSESVATASSQMAQGNQDLSSRTEEQASALQQTATTMEELGSTVRSNAENARQASALAQEAAEVAVRGGEVVGQVVSTMQGISDSSRRIGDIIGTIDGIAFQTNILALNAAVEAARAGEQGRGFAVVASEVRTLAQRSADAAKEIKDLVGRNVGQVEQGAALVERAGRTMDDVVGSIQRVSQITSQISLATQEQSGGVQQVGQAVTQMDQVTQQNAALVEESAAAAASLNAQAQDLVRAVSAFQVAA